MSVIWANIVRYHTQASDRYNVIYRRQNIICAVVYIYSTCKKYCSREYLLSLNKF
jgi:hypothetical protein